MDEIDKIKNLWRRIYELEEERQAISALFPDDATHKHEVTGESLVDNVRDALRDLAKAKADLAAARAELARAYRERDASIKELAEQLADLAAARAGGTR